IECIKQDHGKDFLSKIPRYNGFCLVPSHLDFRQEIDQFYNRYHPLLHEPAEGYPKKTLAFLHHIFGEQLELELDYLKVLLLYPMQILPILCLVSAERNTGKTTFLNFMKAIFGDNMTINSNEDFRSNFNSEWVDKLIIGVDETFLDRKEDSERIKSLSTSRYHKIEAKGHDRQEIQFFGKFILCSNNENNFILIDPGEIRYWIKQLQVLEHDNKNLLEELSVEIPFLLQYLINRPFSIPCTTRMWFRPEQISTPALKKVKAYNRNKLEVEIAQLLLTFIDQKDTVNEVCFCVSDVQGWLKMKGFKYDTNSIRRILQEHWRLAPSANSNAYLQYRISLDGSLYEYNHKGRFFRLSREEILELNFITFFDEKIITI
ncbi:MAG: primase-helicase family protein, partial [Chitinophagaceae bacterium]